VEVGVPFAVREIQPTPNPNAVKFVLDQSITEQPASFFNASQAKDHPIAARLFAISGVNNVLLLGDFVTVGKTPESRWADIRNAVKQVLSSS
jgi:Scaffold protein Nfu/NifU N terminal